MYQKEIIYIHLFENNLKCGCAGFLKIEKKKDSDQIMLQVKNVPAQFFGEFPIRLQLRNNWEEIGKILIEAGCGKWDSTLDEPASGVEIILSDTYKIRGESRMTQVNETEQSPKPEAIDSSEEQNVQVLNDPLYIEQDEPDNIQNDTAKSEPEIIKTDNISRSPRSTHDTRTSALYENKWEQLMATYTQIHPYGDDRVYIKIEPKDFVVLRSNYQHLVNNSFLLHGFYNYRYLILGKERDFYIGVPGVFYEREKMVALMFGFEAFECEGGDAEEGKFGYYLRKVEI